MREQSAYAEFKGFIRDPWYSFKYQRMSGTANPESEGVVSKVKVKKQIKTIVKDLENVLGNLKDVAKELKEVGASLLFWIDREF